MARAVEAFERVGLKVIPGPVEYRGQGFARPGVLGWLPTAGALGATKSVLREYVGRLWYAMRY